MRLKEFSHLKCSYKTTKQFIKFPSIIHIIKKWDLANNHLLIMFPFEEAKNDDDKSLSQASGNLTPHFLFYKFFILKSPLDQYSIYRIIEEVSLRKRWKRQTTTPSSLNFLWGPLKNIFTSSQNQLTNNKFYGHLTTYEMKTIIIKIDKKCHNFCAFYERIYSEGG